MFLKEISHHTTETINFIIKRDPTKYGLPVAGALAITAALFFYIRPFETCVKKWEMPHKEIKLIRRRVGINKSDLVWKVFNKRTKTTSTKVALDDINSSHSTYLKHLPTYDAKERFHAHHQKTLDQLKVLVKEMSSSSEASQHPINQSIASKTYFVNRHHLLMQNYEKTQKTFLRTIPIQNRISFFLDHWIDSANPFPTLRKITSPSQFNGDIIIDRDHMALTVLSRSGKKYCGAGHAVIAYEGIFRGNPFIHYAHLKKIGNSPYGKVEIINDRTLSDEKNISQSTTWRKESWKITNMIREIHQQIDQQNKGVRYLFHWFGRNSIVNIIDSTFKGRFKVDEIPHNCMTWAIQILRHADIILPEDLVLADIPALQVRELRDVRDEPRGCVIS